MNDDVLQVIEPGPLTTIQDQGRCGWRKFGVPRGGAIDRHAAEMANRLLGNAPWAPVLEILLHGARMQFRQAAWIALTGADLTANVPRWRTLRMKSGDHIALARQRNGLWAYLAIEGGWEAPRWLDSASMLPSAGIGRPLEHGQLLTRDASEPRYAPPAGVGARFASPEHQRHYERPPPLRVHRGPQWEEFSPAARAALFATAWTVGPQSNRVGYRFQGPPLPTPARSFISEPVPLGSIQIPPDGRPLVIMPDGPTVGGYPKIGIVDLADCDWLAQCGPGQSVHFRPAEGEPQGTDRVP